MVRPPASPRGKLGDDEFADALQHAGTGEVRHENTGEPCLVLRLFGAETALLKIVLILTQVVSVQRQLQALGFRSQRGIALGGREGDERGSWHEMLFHERPPSVTLRQIQSTAPRRRKL